MSEGEGSSWNCEAQTDDQKPPFKDDSVLPEYTSSQSDVISSTMHESLTEEKECNKAKESSKIDQPGNDADHDIPKDESHDDNQEQTMITKRTSKRLEKEMRDGDEDYAGGNMIKQRRTLCHEPQRGKRNTNSQEAQVPSKKGEPKGPPSQTKMKKKKTHMEKHVLQKSKVHKESILYKTVVDNETTESVAEKFQVQWRDIADINEFRNTKGVMKPPQKNQKFILGTELNLPCLKIKIPKVMKIMKNMTQEELDGTLKETGDPMNPYNVEELQARKWKEPKDFWDCLLGPLWREWIKAIRKEMKGFKDNEVFMGTKRNDLHPNQKIIPTERYIQRNTSTVNYRE